MHEHHQEGTGSHYSQTYYYGNSDDSIVDIIQKGNANHNSRITLTGNEHTTLNLTQQGNSNQSYVITNSCYTSGGCTINVTQGN